jgi:hypothetical protein
MAACMWRDMHTTIVYSRRMPEIIAAAAEAAGVRGRLRVGRDPARVKRLH